MSLDPVTMDMSRTALVLADFQNDFLHPEGAYGRAGEKAELVAAAPHHVVPVANAMRDLGGWVVSTHFTLMPDREGEPFISAHLKSVRPFLGRGDFMAGGWGHDLLEELKPAHIKIEKVAFSAFYQSRMEWTLRKAGIENLIFTGIVTNGGVASTLRDAHVRDFDTILLSDGCGAFTQQIHDTAIDALRPVSHVMSCAEFLAALARR